MRLNVRPLSGSPDFLDLPFAVPLEDWDIDRLVEVPRGLHRHVVRAVRYDHGLYMVKELPDRYARREYELLGRLEAEGVDAASPAAVVVDRHDEEGAPLPGLVITRHLEYALPYRLLFARESHEHLREAMIDALAELLVRIHLVGFLWGDCSLSNALFRRDAGRLTAWLVDAETGEWHEELSHGQRRLDLDLAVEKCAGELMDLIAQGVVVADADPVELGEELVRRYECLWSELTREESFGSDEGWRVNDRLRRINELGYDIEELELVGEGDQIKLRLSTRVVEPGRHRRRLLQLTGLQVAGEQQALELLNDITAFGAWLQWNEGRSLSQEQIAHRWVDDIFEVMIAAVPADLIGRRDEAQIFWEMLQHRQWLSESQGRDVSNDEAMASYVRNVLTFAPHERVPEDVE